MLFVKDQISVYPAMHLSWFRFLWRKLIFLREGCDCTSRHLVFCLSSWCLCVYLSLSFLCFLFLPSALSYIAYYYSSLVSYFTSVIILLLLLLLHYLIHYFIINTHTLLHYHLPSWLFHLVKSSLHLFALVLSSFLVLYLNQ
jgi:hypothetical protein